MLRGLRRQLREAIATRLAWQAAAAVALACWLALIIDRLIEPDATLRLAAGVVLIVLGLGWLAGVAFPRLAKAITDRQVITLLHRDHPAEAGMISTALDLLEGKSPNQNRAIGESILASADAAAADLEGVRLVRPPAAMGSVAFAGIAIAGAMAFGIARPDMASCFAKRVALSEAPWPRRVELIADGFEWNADTGEWTRVAPRGEPADFTIVATVDSQQTPPRTVWSSNPERRGSTALTRVGPPVVGETTQQAYRQRIDRLDRDRQLTIRGGDGYLQLRLVAADRPSLTEVSLLATPPSYLHQPPISTTPTSLSALPEGSRVTLSASSTKTLASVVAKSRAANDSVAMPIEAAVDTAGVDLSLKTGPLAKATVLEVTVTDADGLSAEPFELTIEIAKDQPPNATIALDGVGRAVTRDARIPFVIVPDDDHGLGSVELLLTTENRHVSRSLSTPERLPAKVRGVADLLSMRSAGSNDRLAVQPGDRLTLSARVADRYDLQPRDPTESRPIEIEIITRAELLARVGDAQRELRQTVEGLLADMQRLEYELDLRQRRNSDEADTPGNWRAERLLDVRKATEGIAAAAERAEGLRAQVVNNRIDQPALVERLKRRIAAPLQRLVEEELAAASDALEADNDSSLPAALQNVQRTAETLLRVVGSLETQQTYNEVVALLRGLIREQRRVNQRTERQEGQSVRSLFD